MLNPFITVILVSLFVCSKTQANIGFAEFLSIQNAAKNILKSFPKDEYAYIGVGRSPTPVIAYLQTESNVLAKNLPLSDFRFNIPRLSGRPYLPLKDFEIIDLFKHFDQFLPNQVEMNGKTKMLLIDFIFTGSTLVSAAVHVDMYLKNRQRNLTFDLFGMGFKGIGLEMKLKENLRCPFFQQIHFFEISYTDPFLEKMFYKKYSGYAQYPRFSFYYPKTVYSRKEYSIYVEQLEFLKQYRLSPKL